MPDLAPRLVVIPQSVVFDDTIGPSAPAGALGRAPGSVLLFPAGIRKVKPPRFAVEPLERLLARFPTLELLYAGPVIEADEGDELFRLLRSRSWARYVSVLARDRMRGLLRNADVILNCSRSEGGTANSVLEALAMGRAAPPASRETGRSSRTVSPASCSARPRSSPTRPPGSLRIPCSDNGSETRVASSSTPTCRPPGRWRATLPCTAASRQR